MRVSKRHCTQHQTLVTVVTSESTIARMSEEMKVFDKVVKA